MKMQQNGIHELVEKLKTEIEIEALHPWLENTKNLDGKLRVMAAKTFGEFSDSLDKNRIPHAIDATSEVIHEYLPLVEQVKQERRIYRRKGNRTALLTGLGASLAFYLGLSIDSYFRYGRLAWLEVENSSQVSLMALYFVGIAAITALFVKAHYNSKGRTFRHFIDDVPEMVRNNYLVARNSLFRRIEGAYHRSASR